MPPTDDKPEEDRLDAAKRKLSETRGRPFDVDKTIAQLRARQEREHEAQKKAEAKLEEEYGAARQRRHELRARAVESSTAELIEKERGFEERKAEIQRKKKPRGGVRKNRPEE